MGNFFLLHLVCISFQFMPVVSCFPATHTGEVPSSLYLDDLPIGMGRLHICLPLVVREIPGPPQSFKDVSGLARTWASSLGTLGCNCWVSWTWREQDLSGNPRVNAYPLACSFPLSPEAWETLLMKTETEKALSTLALSVPCVTKSLSLFSNGPTSSLFSL